MRIDGISPYIQYPQPFENDPYDVDVVIQEKNQVDAKDNAPNSHPFVSCDGSCSCSNCCTNTCGVGSCCS